MTKTDVPDSKDQEESDRDFVNSFARGLQVIRAFTREHRSMTLSEVAERTGMNRAATRRFLLTLVQEEYAETDGKRFSLRPKILDLGFSALASLDINDVAQPLLNDLSERIQESCFVVILDGESVVYIAKSYSRRTMTATMAIGSRAPAFIMSSGRVLLSARPKDEVKRYLASLKVEKRTPHTITSKAKLMDEVNEAGRAGFCMVDQEFEIGLRSISVPIRDRSNAVIAALNVACPSPRFTLDDMRERVLPVMLETAATISRFVS